MRLVTRDLRVYFNTLKQIVPNNLNSLHIYIQQATYSASQAARTPSEREGGRRGARAQPRTGGAGRAVTRPRRTRRASSLHFIVRVQYLSLGIYTYI